MPYQGPLSIHYLSRQNKKRQKTPLVAAAQVILLPIYIKAKGTIGTDLCADWPTLCQR